ncbi:unnamed protein product [Penicillium salamii]|uniref:Uncharacterized protein n=1 Tax=Penicillium salamii TaxID=1612424 RepID=A0A9W4NIK4_9EURO|nr:unnamed protein product [Penicillium salamii]CAG8224345.1 unnamed protein product [Penicillium salamii]CAG8290516.1 unnamed protein product [Penicillium salamii]CAG8318625.1 unnamed protein product [Penicillium salamii]CAG8331182.1 unnamed protein product [Penicillium salamii]
MAATTPVNENGLGLAAESVTSTVDEPKTAQTSEQEVDSESEHPPPSEEEKQTLRKVAGSLPLVSFSLCLVEFAERASYYGAKTVFSNFVQFPLPEGGNGAGSPPRGTQKTAGALGMGLQASSGITLLFLFLSYVIPIFGGWWADVHIGRYKAICVGVFICGIAHIIQVFGAIPSVLQKGAANGAPPFIIGLLLLAFGAGIFKPNVSPLILDQNPHRTAYTKTLKSGEKVIVDPEATTNRIMLIFYGFVNVGAFFMLATTYSEKYVGFWLSFLLAGLIYLLLPILLAAMYKKTYKRPPAGSSEISQAFKIIVTALRQSKFQFWRKDFWELVTPAELSKKGITVNWTEKDVKNVSRTVAACDIFWFYPIWNLNDGGIGSVSTNQGASMITDGVPNDVLSNFNPLTIMVVIPILSFVIYPTLRRYRINFGPISRITFGFFLAILAGLAGALVQWRIYSLSPCGNLASTCDTVAPISIWWQLPNTILSALSECFCNVTAYELAYARSPDGMKGLVVAFFLFMNALSSAIGEIMLPATADPWLTWIWGAPAIALALQTVIFWFRFKHLNHESWTGEEDTETVVREETKV